MESIEKELLFVGVFMVAVYFIAYHAEEMEGIIQELLRMIK